MSQFPSSDYLLHPPTFFRAAAIVGEGQEMHNRLDLRPLSKRDSRHLVREILHHVVNIPTELRDLIVNGAEGWRVETKQLAKIKVPPTLTGVLQARLDSLPEIEQDVLKRAAVIGRVFWDNAIESLRISDKGPPTRASVNDTLQPLRTRELVFRREVSSFEDTHEYIFKHAILRDVTYESVLFRQRCELHAQAAAWLIEKSGAQVEQYAGLIGEHCEKAQQPVDAIEWYGRAGKQAMDTYAPETARDCYQKALKLLAPQQRKTAATIKRKPSQFHRR